MNIDYDVAIIGGGPAGLYSSIIIQRGIPTQSTSENLKVAVFDSGPMGGLANFAFIQISKKWAFSGSNVKMSFVEEAQSIGIELHENVHIHKVETIEDEQNPHLALYTATKRITAKYVIVAIGIMNNPFVLQDPKVTIGLHTAQHMIEELELKNRKKIIIYGPYEASLNELKEYFELHGSFESVSVRTMEKEAPDLLGGISDSEYKEADCILLDYNSYKVINGATQLLELDGVKYKNGFILTDEFGKTHNELIYAAGQYQSRRLGY